MEDHGCSNADDGCHPDSQPHRAAKMWSIEFYKRSQDYPDDETYFYAFA
jgi:hypothetical protein